jgi:hypothetical protein
MLLTSITAAQNELQLIRSGQRFVCIKNACSFKRLTR